MVVFRPMSGVSTSFKGNIRLSSCRHCSAVMFVNSFRESVSFIFVFTCRHREFYSRQYRVYINVAVSPQAYAFDDFTGMPCIVKRRTYRINILSVIFSCYVNLCCIIVTIMLHNCDTFKWRWRRLSTRSAFVIQFAKILFAVRNSGIRRWTPLYCYVPH